MGENEIKQILEDHEKRIKKLENFLESPKVEKIKKISVKEFLLEVKPSSDVERTAAFGFFLENQRGYTSFTTENITACFREAREKVPDNVTDKINKCIANGWIMKHNEKKDNKNAFVMTRSGENIVKTKFRDGKE